jgi:hypothetical protein
MSDANLMSMAVREESTWGEAASGKYTEIPFTSEGLKQLTEFLASQTIRADRLTPDLRRIGVNVAGPIAAEVSFGDHDLFYEMVMGSAGFAAQAVSLNAGSVTSVATNTYNGTFTNLPAVGDWIYVSGFTGNDVDKNGFKKVTASSGSAIAVAQTLVNKGSTTSGVTITKCGMASLGTNFRSVSIEKEFTDLTNEFVQYLGVAIDQWQLSVSADSLVTQTFDVMGKLEQSAAATIGDGANTAVQDAPSFSGAEDVYSVQVNYVPIDILSGTMRLGAGIRKRPVVGSIYPKSLGLGRFVLEGTFQMYFENDTYMDFYRAWTPKPVTYIIQDENGSGYVFDALQTNLTDAQQVGGGIDQDIIAEFTFRAKLEAIQGGMFKVARFDAAA